MSLIDINWRPTHRQLRQFAVICFIALPLVGILWTRRLDVIAALAGIGFVLMLVGWFRPAAVKPVFLALTLIATPIGIVVGELAMLTIYFAVFLPIGLVFRLLRRDELQLAFDPRTKSYWQAKPQAKGAASYYRQSQS
jgi:hypothetical protein